MEQKKQKWPSLRMRNALSLVIKLLMGAIAILLVGLVAYYSLLLIMITM